MRGGSKDNWSHIKRNFRAKGSAQAYLLTLVKEGNPDHPTLKRSVKKTTTSQKCRVSELVYWGGPSKGLSRVQAGCTKGVHLRIGFALLRMMTRAENLKRRGGWGGEGTKSLLAVLLQTKHHWLPLWLAPFRSPSRHSPGHVPAVPHKACCPPPARATMVGTLPKCFSTGQKGGFGVTRDRRDNQTSG